MRRFLKIGLNIAILLVIAGFIWYMIRSVNKEEITYADVKVEEPFSTSYEQVNFFELPDEIKRFELEDNKLFVVAGQTVFIHDTEGESLKKFDIKSDVRDIMIDEQDIYVLYPDFIEVYSEDGQISREWEACSELSDYCSLALAGDFVFVTDAENKNICKYTREGNFVQFIKSPLGFIIPSYSFDIASLNDTIYCVNSGRHLVESYSLNGDFIAAFGGPGGGAGYFAGCCNPSYISFTSDGDLITSEKGNPRISAFERTGEFKEIVLNSRFLGGGNKAYETKADGNNLFVAGNNRITIFKK